MAEVAPPPRPIQTETRYPNLRKYLELMKRAAYLLRVRRVSALRLLPHPAPAANALTRGEWFSSCQRSVAGVSPSTSRPHPRPVPAAPAERRGVPIFNAFGWIDSRPGFYCSLIVLAVVCGLAVLQLASVAQLLGQAPVTWAALIALLYAWLMLPLSQPARPRQVGIANIIITSV